MGMQTEMMLSEEAKQDTIRLLTRMRQLLDEDDNNSSLSIELLCALAIERIDDDEREQELQQLMDKDD